MAHGDGVSLWALCAVAGLILAWSLLSAHFERFDVSGPIVFVLGGLILGHGPIEQLHMAAETTFIHELAEITLVLVLFSGAARVDPGDLRRHAGLPLRLLAIGLPLTIAAGFGLAAALLTDVPWQLAALLGAALAPPTPPSAPRWCPTGPSRCGCGGRSTSRAASTTASPPRW